MTHIPSDEEVLQQLAELRLENPNVGILKAVQQIKHKNPGWGLTAKRLRTVSKQAEIQRGGGPENEPNDHPNLKPNNPSPVSDQPTNESPMSALMNVLGRFMAGGDRQAAKRAAQIDMTFKQAPDVKRLVNNPRAFGKTDLTFLGSGYPMRSCKLAVTIMLQIVAPDELLYGCIAWSSRSLGGLPTAMHVHTQPSASLPLAFTRAKDAALNHHQSTALAVNIIDVEMLERGEGIKSGSLNYMSFSHAFVMFVGPEGVRVLQAWGEHGYSLADNIRSPAARLRDWIDAEAFVNQYDQLVGMEPAWNAKTYEAYKQCFGVDIPKITGRSGPERKPVVPYFRPWTRIKEISNVKTNDISRWFSVMDVVDSLLRK